MSFPLTFVSDFDGVWTNPKRELQAVHQTVQTALRRMCGWSQEHLEEVYAHFREQVLHSPHQYGWRIDGVFSSFVDEDYFAMPTSIAQYIDDAPCEYSVELKSSVLQEFETVLSFVDSCYASTCENFRNEVDHDLAEGSARVLQWLIDNDVNVVFVTNAPTEKITTWFAHHGFSVDDGRSTAPGSSRLRVYGRAGKQHLGPSGRSLDFCGRNVQCDRPQYRAVLERESPDLVIGDVLSLDLSQPLAMRVDGNPAAPSAVGIMHLPHTPEWVLGSIGQETHEIDYLVPHVTSIPRVVERVRENSLIHG